MVGFLDQAARQRVPVYLRPGYTFAFVHVGHLLLEFACTSVDEIYSSPLTLGQATVATRASNQINFTRPWTQSNGPRKSTRQLFAAYPFLIDPTMRRPSTPLRSYGVCGGYRDTAEKVVRWLDGFRTRQEF